MLEFLVPNSEATIAERLRTICTLPHIDCIDRQYGTGIAARNRGEEVTISEGVVVEIRLDAPFVQ